MFSAGILFFFAPALADFAIKFSYVEKFLIIFLALTVIASLFEKSAGRHFQRGAGVCFSLIGTYDISVGGNGEARLMFDFMVPYLENGFSLLPVLIGLFGLATILQEAEQGVRKEPVSADVNLSARAKFSLRFSRDRSSTCSALPRSAPLSACSRESAGARPRFFPTPRRKTSPRTRPRLGNGRARRVLSLRKPPTTA